MLQLESRYSLENLAALNSWCDKHPTLSSLKIAFCTSSFILYSYANRAKVHIRHKTIGHDALEKSIYSQ